MYASVTSVMVVIVTCWVRMGDFCYWVGIRMTCNGNGTIQIHWCFVALVKRPRTEAGWRYGLLTIQEVGMTYRLNVLQFVDDANNFILKKIITW